MKISRAGNFDGRECAKEALKAHHQRKPADICGGLPEPTEESYLRACILQDQGSLEPVVWTKNNKAGKAEGRRRLKEALKAHNSWKPADSSAVLRFTDQLDVSGVTAPQASVRRQVASKGVLLTQHWPTHHYARSFTCGAALLGNRTTIECRQ